MLNVWTVKTEEGQVEAQALTALCETKKMWNAECVNCEDWRRAEAWTFELEAQENST